MRIGTRSILFGVHQFFWHPLTVLLAWRKLYKSWPDWPELLAIIFHDVGYWRMPNMDGPEGKYHPYAGALLTTQIYLRIKFGYWVRGVPPENCHGNGLFWFTALHSRDTAKMVGGQPSKLYAADKCAILFDPCWFYLLRARLSGELAEYKQHAIDSGYLQPDATDREWYKFYRNHVINRPDIKKLL